MTREEAFNILHNGLVNAPSERDWCIAFKMAIKALEQEPCDDAISRQAVLEIANSSKSNWIDNSVLFKRVNKLPPVNPQNQIGHWIFKNGKYRCDACGEKAIYCYSGSSSITQREILTKYCANCGTRMESEE